MVEILFEDDFLNSKLDLERWRQVGGITNSRRNSKKFLGMKYGIGEVKVLNSYLYLYGGGRKHDHGIRTMQTFSPYEGPLLAKFKASIERPKPKEDGIWIGFRVADGDIDRYVPFAVISTQQKKSPRSPITIYKLIRYGQPDYTEHFEIRANNVIANSVDEEGKGLLRTQVSNGFDIKSLYHNIELLFSIRGVAAKIDDQEVAGFGFIPADAHYRFMFYASNNARINVDKIQISRV